MGGVVVVVVVPRTGHPGLEGGHVRNATTLVVVVGDPVLVVVGPVALVERVRVWSVVDAVVVVIGVERVAVHVAVVVVRQGGRVVLVREAVGVGPAAGVLQGVRPHVVVVVGVGVVTGAVVVVVVHLRGVVWEHVLDVAMQVVH